MAEISIDGILAENKRRLHELVHSEFDPITGWQSVGDRFLLELPDYEIKRQWLPVSMRKEPFVKRLIKAGSVRKMLKEMGQPWCPQSRASLALYFVKLRCQHDFPYWAASFAFIKNKHGGDDIRFKLTYPQRKFVGELEKRRLEKKPIRLVMLKARQWGGSTTSQLYMAWLQFTQLKGWNSLIIAQQNKGSYEIKDMFDRMLKHYPLSMLHDLGETYRPNEPKTQNVDKSGETVRVIARNAKIKVGSAESPDSCRGGDYALVHLSEVGLWKKTEGKSPEDIVRSACAGVLYRPNTMIVYESTANGVGNFFHREYNDAKENPKSQFDAFFVPWFDIGEYVLDIEDERAFAEELVRHRGNTQELTNREEPGAYYWQLWQNGATLQGINWYMVERGKVQSHSAMAAEYPSDDVEAFVNSGAQVFDKYLVDRFRPATKFVPRIGELVGDMEQGEDALKNLHFVEDSQGAFKVWSLPDPPDDNAIVKNQYLVVVDIGGRGNKADWSVICVIDRIMMMEGGASHTSLPSGGGIWILTL